MGKLTNFSIEFSNNQNGIFAPGQTVTGSVIVELKAPMKLQALKIEFYGYAYVHWSESEGSGDNRETHHYVARETYFNSQVSLYGKGSGGANEHATTLAAGRNAFPITYQLPTQLPSSFESHIGRVRYCVKATIVKPWKFNHNTKVAFTVLDTLDLNQDPSARLEINKCDSKTLCCWCCASGPIEAQVHLDRKGYVPGEFILVSGSVENASSSYLPATKAILKQNVVYRASGKSVNRMKKVAKLVGPGCAARRSITWNNDRLQFVVVAPSGSSNLKVNVPVTLGNIPLQGLTPYTLPASQAPVPNAPGLPQPSAPASSAFTPPPPSYVSAVGGAVNIKDDKDNNYIMGQTTYTPQYAYYDWSQSAVSHSNE